MSVPAPLRATYRIQLQPGFGFAAAARIIPALARLGISHLYLSPCLAARTGSTHGYDVVDPTCFAPALGSMEEYEALVACLREHSMGVILDLVPNHLGVMGSENAWWLDLMEHGRASAYSQYFDVDWEPVRRSLHDKVLVPVLGEHFGTTLESGELRLALDAGSGSLRFEYHEHVFPLDPVDYGALLAEAGNSELEALGRRFAALAGRDGLDEAARAERRTAAASLKRKLAELCRDTGRVGRLEAVLAGLNGSSGDPASFDRLESLLSRQAYRLAYWRVASDEINYRRFFDINDLAAICVERDKVFTAVHSFTAELAARGLADGVRIDHADGLYDPARYFVRLREALPQVGYVVAEKILGAHERLPDDWAVDGTTGYEFGRLATAWLIPPDAAEAFTRTYADFLGARTEFDAVAVESKRRVLTGPMASEVTMLAGRLDRIARRDRHTMDFTRNRLREAIIEAVAFFPVYRTYATARGIGDGDVEHVRWAIARARRHSSTEDPGVFDFLEEVLTLRFAADASEARRADVIEFVMRFQQLCAPAMAKGVEDTAFYIYNRFVALNEVGGDPRRFGLTSGGLHQANAERAGRHPLAMLSTSTHDSKRSEDVRARLAALAEVPEKWRKGLARWNRLNRPRKRIVGERRVPTRNDEYLFYQSLLGLWPREPLDADRLGSLRGRLVAYMQKAAREAKLETSWIHPDEQYEAALTEWISRLLGRIERNRFLDEFAALATEIVELGEQNSLSQTLLKLTCPGVPDIYQGCEREMLALVDPDNRAPLDPASLDPAAGTASAKFDMTRRVLALRRRLPEVFGSGSYLPLGVSGPAEDCLIAYARGSAPATVVVIVPRFPGRRRQGAAGARFWQDTWVEWPEAVDAAACEDVLSGSPARPEKRSDGLWLPAVALPEAFPGALYAPRPDA